MALSRSDVMEIYTWLSASWPTVLKPGAPDDFVRMKHRELMADFGGYDKDEVLEAIKRWREQHDKFPATKNIINEIEWSRRERIARQREADPEAAEGWPMEIVYANGDEACYGVFTREQFVNHPKNPDHLQPEEWKRRFRMRRARIDAELGRISQTRYTAFMAKMSEIRG